MEKQELKLLDFQKELIWEKLKWLDNKNKSKLLKTLWYKDQSFESMIDDFLVWKNEFSDQELLDSIPFKSYRQAIYFIWDLNENWILDWIISDKLKKSIKENWKDIDTFYMMFWWFIILWAIAYIWWIWLSDIFKWPKSLVITLIISAISFLVWWYFPIKIRRKNAFKKEIKKLHKQNLVKKLEKL